MIVLGMFQPINSDGCHQDCWGYFPSGADVVAEPNLVVLKIARHTLAATIKDLEKDKIYSSQDMSMATQQSHQKRVRAWTWDSTFFGGLKVGCLRFSGFALCWCI